MPRTVPSYRQRHYSDQAVVTLGDSVTKERRDFWLGTFNTPESLERYHRLIAEWEIAGRRLPMIVESSGESSSSSSVSAMTVAHVISSYWDYAKSYYQPSEAGSIKMVVHLLNRLYGRTPAVAFGPKALRLVRDEMIRGDASLTPPRASWSRPYVNQQVKRIKRLFKWAASHELIPVSVYQQLATVEPLKRGRVQNIRENEPVRPGPDELVNAIQPFVSEQVWALIELQRLTGARGGELLKLRLIELHLDDKTGIWSYKPIEHKTAYREKERTIYFGPRAQEVIRPFMENRPLDAYLFSPAEAEAKRRAKLTARRKAPDNEGNRPGSNRRENPLKQPGDYYDADTYYRAIQYGCEKAFPLPEHLRRIKVKGRKSDKTVRRETAAEWRQRLGPAKWEELRVWRKNHHWHPHQLRHAAGTAIRRQFGLEAAQIALGHCSAQITDAVYAERDLDKVVEMMKKIG